jgi:hypothetical protein
MHPDDLLKPNALILCLHTLAFPEALRAMLCIFAVSIRLTGTSVYSIFGKIA